MRAHTILRLLLVLTLTAISLFSFIARAQAMAPMATVGTTLTILPPTPQSVGNPATVEVQLISSKDEPVPDQAVELFINDEPFRRARTDSAGTVSFRILRDEAGTYALSAVFKGSKSPSLGSSKASGELVINPELIEIQTTPSLSGVKFSLDNRIFSSDAYGVARIEVNKVGTYHLQLLPLDAKNADIQMAFGRWGDDTFEPARDIQIPLNKPLQIGFEISYKVSQTFVDLDNRPVDPARVTSVTLKGSNGTTYTFEDKKPHWLQAGRVIRLNNGLEQTKILYSVISVVIDGSNVVSQAQQRFFANQNDLWTVQLLLYRANFMSRDALFRFPIGSGIHVQYPDGETKTFSFDSNQKQTIDGLARGIYRVTVIGAKGLAPTTPIALSRDQDVELLVFSNLDIGVVAALGLVLSLGLLLFGRPYIVRETAVLAYSLIPKRQKLQPVLQQLSSKLKAQVSRIDFGSRWQKVQTSLSGLFSKLKTQVSHIDFGSRWQKAQMALSGLFSKLKTQVSSIDFGSRWQKAQMALSGLFSKLKTQVSSIDFGSRWQKVQTSLSGLFSKLKAQVSRIHPSREMTDFEDRGPATPEQVLTEEKPAEAAPQPAVEDAPVSVPSDVSMTSPGSPDGSKAEPKPLTPKRTRRKRAKRPADSLV